MSDISMNPLADLDTESLYFGKHPRTGEVLPVDHPAVLAAREKVTAYYETTYDNTVDLPEQSRQIGVARTLQRAEDAYRQSDEYEAATGHRSMTLDEYAESESPANPTHHAWAKFLTTATQSEAYLNPRHPDHAKVVGQVEQGFKIIYGG